MYRPPEDIHELRQKGLPWLIAATVLLIACVSSGVFYVLMYHRHEFIGLSSTESIPVGTQIEHPEVKEFFTETPSPVTEHTREEFSDRDRYDVPLSEEDSDEYLEFNKQAAAEAPTTIVAIEERIMSTVAISTRTPLTTTLTVEITPTTKEPRITFEPTTGVSYSEIPTTSIASETTPTTTLVVTTPSLIFYTPPERIKTTASTQETSTDPPATTSSTIEETIERVSNKTKEPIEAVSYAKAAVTSVEEVCSEIGLSMLIRGGNAVEAAIATEFCIGSVDPHLTGLAASSIIMVHQSSSGKTTVMNAQAVAPRSATATTYMMNKELAKKGYSSIAVPGSLAGLWTAFKRFGSGQLLWQDLLLPSIELLEKGFPISESLRANIGKYNNEWVAEKTMISNYNTSIEGTGSNRIYAETLRRLASSREPSQLFYRGDMANQIVQEMRSRGGLISKLDLVNYAVKIEEALETQIFHGVTLIGPYPPSEFASLAYVVGSILDKYRNNSTALNPQNFNEDISLLLSNAEHFSADLMDPSFYIDSKELAVNLTTSEFRKGHVFEREKDINRDQVGSHTNVMDETGMVVTITSTLNAPFGSQRRSEKLGFVWNNLMDAFSTDDTDDEGDIVEGNKRPRTGMIPVIMVDKTRSRNISLLAAGGTGSNIKRELAKSIIYELLPEQATTITEKAKNIIKLRKFDNRIRSQCRSEDEKCAKGI